MIIHLHGKLVPVEQAAVSPFDRGFVFGDAVYEGLRSFGRRIVGLDRHVARMRNALREARIDWDPAQLGPLSDALLRANGMHDAFVYWQVTRGTPGPGQPVRTRTPAGPMTPTVFGYCSPQPPIEKFASPPVVSAAVQQDCRWTRGHLKSTSLMGNVLASMDALDTGAQDAIFVRDGLVAEGSATNVIVALPRGGSGRVELATPSLESVSILGGITRAQIMDGAPEVVSRPVRVEELYRASEIMLVGSTAMVTAVTRLDGRPVGGGDVGPQTRRLLKVLVETIVVELGLHGGLGGSPAGILKQCSTSQAVA